MEVAADLTTVDFPTIDFVDFANDNVFSFLDIVVRVKFYRRGELGNKMKDKM